MLIFAPLAMPQRKDSESWVHRTQSTELARVRMSTQGKYSRSKPSSPATHGSNVVRDIGGHEDRLVWQEAAVEMDVAVASSCCASPVGGKIQDG